MNREDLRAHDFRGLIWGDGLRTGFQCIDLKQHYIR